MRSVPQWRRAISLSATSLFLVLGFACASTAGIGDSPLPLFPDNTPSMTVLEIAGVVNRSGVATVILCSSLHSSNVHVGVEVFDDAAVLQNDVHAGEGAVLNIAPGATVTVATSATEAFLESSVLSVDPEFTQGSARVVASSPAVRCSVLIAEDGVTPPVSLSTLRGGIRLAAGAVPASKPLPTFGDGNPAVASAMFPGAANRNSLETAVLCTSLSTGNVDIGVEVFESDGTRGNDIAMNNGAVLNVLPGQTVTFGTTGTAALLETEVVALPPIAQGFVRAVSNSTDVLCSAMSLDASIAPPASMTELAGYGASGATTGDMLPRALPLFADESPSIAVATLPGVVKRGLLQTVFLCSSRASLPVHIGVEVYDRFGVLQNDVSTGVGAVLGVAPGATVTIATSATGAYLESAVIPIADGLQGVARIVATSGDVSCTSVIVEDTATPPVSMATLAAPVRPYSGALPPTAPLPTFSNGTVATHVAVFPGLTKRSDVETEIACTSIATRPVHIGVEVLTPAGSVANDVGAANGELLGVAPGETVFFGTTGSAAFLENEVIVLPGIAQGMARVVSDSGDLLCAGIVFDQAASPPASMTSLGGFAASCGDGILQPAEQCDTGIDGACPGNCDDDCLCPPVCGDGFVQAGEECDDDNTSSGDCCSAGCQLECDDGSACTQDACSAGVCTFEAAPLASCREAGRSSFQLGVGATPDRSRMKWGWSTGPQVAYGDLGSPNSSSTFTICVYDSTGGVATLASSLILPPSPLWIPRFPSRWSYRDRDSLVAGISSVKIQAGSAGRTKLGVKAAGAGLPTPTPFDPLELFDADPSVIVQMRNDETSACWQSSFSTFTTNDGTRYKAKTP